MGRQRVSKPANRLVVARLGSITCGRDRGVRGHHRGNQSSTQVNEETTANPSHLSSRGWICLRLSLAGNIQLVGYRDVFPAKQHLLLHTWIVSRHSHNTWGLWTYHRYPTGTQERRCSGKPLVLHHRWLCVHPVHHDDWPVVGVSLRINAELNHSMVERKMIMWLQRLAGFGTMQSLGGY